MTQQQKLIKRLKAGWLTANQWCKESGSTKLTSRISDIRDAGVIVKDEWITLKSRKKIKQYRIISKQIDNP